MRSSILAAAAAFLIAPSVAPTPVAAQEEVPQPMKYENVAWYEIVQIDFKPGKAGDAMEIIEKYFEPAAEEAGTPTPEMALRHQTGEWDLTVIWHMKRGPAGMEWKTTPEGIAWQKKFVELAGGEERADEIGDEFDSYIARENVTIARRATETPGGGD